MTAWGIAVRMACCKHTEKVTGKSMTVWHGHVGTTSRMNPLGGIAEKDRLAGAEGMCAVKTGGYIHVGMG